MYYSGDEGATWVKLNRVVKQAAAPANGGTSTNQPQGASDASKPPENGNKPVPNGEGTGALPVSAPKAQPVAISAAAQPSAGNGAPGAPTAATAAASKDDGKAAKATDAKRKSDSLKDTSFAWETTEVPDGRYLIKIVASDRPSNPTDAHTVERVVGPILVCNTAPQAIVTGEPVVDAERRVRLSGRAQAGAPIAGVDYRVDEEEWISAAAEDAIFDSESERFELQTAALEAGERTIEVRVVDAAGNHVVEKRKVVVR